MGGRPVWLASCSVRDLTKADSKVGGPLLLTTEKWTPLVRLEAMRQLRLALAGVGDDKLERCFRMCATLCVHRAVTDAELAGLSDEWRCVVPRDLAGTPLEVLWQTAGVPDVPSAQPCRAPRLLLVRELAHLGVFIPEGCGRCDTCQARKVKQAEALEEHAAWLAQRAEARLEAERAARSVASGRELTVGEVATQLVAEDARR